MQDLLCIRNLSLLGGIALLLAVLKLMFTVARAYYMLRVRAGVPTVMWWPRFWRIDSTQQRGNSLKRVLPRMQQLGGKHGLYGTVYGALHCAACSLGSADCYSDTSYSESPFVADAFIAEWL
jgi:hypothetical protein